MVWHEAERHEFHERFPRPPLRNILTSDVDILRSAIVIGTAEKIPNVEGGFFVVKFKEVMNETEIVLPIQKDFPLINPSIQDVVDFGLTRFFSHVLCFTLNLSTSDVNRLSCPQGGGGAGW